MKIEFCRQGFEKSSSIRHPEFSPSGSRVVPCGQKDGQTDNISKLTVVFSNFAKEPLNLPIFPLCDVVYILLVER